MAVWNKMHTVHAKITFIKNFKDIDWCQVYNWVLHLANTKSQSTVSLMRALWYTVGLEKYSRPTLRDQDQDQDQEKSVSSALETKTAVSRTTSLVAAISIGLH